MSWVILILGISANTLASLLIKHSTVTPHTTSSLLSISGVMTHWALLLGLVMYGAAFMFYKTALYHFPLHVAHPILTSGAIVSVAILSTLIFNEPLNIMSIFGILFVIFGVLLISMSID